MNQLIKNIIQGAYTTDDKLKALDSIADDLQMARGVMSGKYTYCPYCDEYYLTKSFVKEQQTELARVPVYENTPSGEITKHVNGEAIITYLICPKEHVREINREENPKQS